VATRPREHAATPAVVNDLDVVVHTTGEAGSTVVLNADTGETVLVTDGSRSVRALDAPTGEVRWQTAVDGRVQHPVAVDDHTVVVAHDNGVTALSRSNGERRWGPNVDRNTTLTPPTVADGTALVGVGRELVAFSGEDGTERWRVETSDRNHGDVALGGVTGSPVAVGWTVLLSTQAGDVYALNDG
jgi:outer membrane protein assembly factor BamB